MTFAKIDPIGVENRSGISVKIRKDWSSNYEKNPLTITAACYSDDLLGACVRIV